MLSNHVVLDAELATYSYSPNPGQTACVENVYDNCAQRELHAVRYTPVHITLLHCFQGNRPVNKKKGSAVIG